MHWNDREVIVEESARTLRELREQEEFLKSIIIYFKDEDFEIPARWWRVICPNTLRGHHATYTRYVAHAASTATTEAASVSTASCQLASFSDAQRLAEAGWRSDIRAGP